MSKKHIDSNISEKYGIVNYGKVGMQIIREGRSIGIFKKKPTQLENWLDAVAFCQMTYYTPIDPASGSGAFLKDAADDLTKNPPYITPARDAGAEEPE